MSEILGALNFRNSSKLLTSFEKKLNKINHNYNNYKFHDDKIFKILFSKKSIFINKDNNLVICLYGYIFNLNKLSSEYNFSYDNSLLFLYKKLGIKDLLNILNGDFVLTIYDRNINRLYICRDRFGLRPIFYRLYEGALLFSSRASIINDITNTLDYNLNFIKRFAGYHYRYIDNEPEKSPYKDILQIPASNYIEIKFNITNGLINNNDINLFKYWNFEKNSQVNFDDSEEDLAEKYKDLIQDAVKMRLDVVQNPAFTLSGGMDSSTVLANAVITSGNKQVAFSTVYKDKTYDESEEIASMLDKFVSKWHAIEIEKPNLEQDLDKMIEANDEPIATATWLSNFIMCREINKLGYKNLFGGLGGDELNAGEYEYFFYLFADLLYAEKNNQSFNEEVNLWVKYHNHPIFKKDLNIANDYLSRNIDQNIIGKCTPDQERLNRYSNTILEPLYDENKQPYMKHPYDSYLKNRTYQDIFYETVPCSVRAQLRNANYYNIDNFLPFLDYRLVEFMFKVPNKFKIKNGITKILLRKSMKNILPNETRNRIKKTGWNAPAHLWFSQSSLNFLMDLVNSKKFKERGIYNIKNVNNIINEHLNIIKNNQIKDNHMMFLWQLVNLEIWFQKNEQR